MPNDEFLLYFQLFFPCHISAALTTRKRWPSCTLQTSTTTTATGRPWTWTTRLTTTSTWRSMRPCVTSSPQTSAPSCWSLTWLISTRDLYHKTFFTVQMAPYHNMAKLSGILFDLSCSNYLNLTYLHVAYLHLTYLHYPIRLIKSSLK